MHKRNKNFNHFLFFLSLKSSFCETDFYLIKIKLICYLLLVLFIEVVSGNRYFILL